MKRIRIYIAMLFMIAWGAKAQSVLNGTPGMVSGPAGHRKTIKEAEQSPANIRYKTKPQTVHQFFSFETEEENTSENRERIMTELQFGKENSMRSTAQVKVIDDANQSTPPDPEASKVTSQSPAYTALGNEQGGLDPSDAQIAAGPNHLVVLANDDARILNKQSGAIISEVSLAAFFGWSGFVFDPRIVYDPYGGRWIALALRSTGCGSDSKFRVMISDGIDPTLGWYYYEIDVDAANNDWMDFAMLGFNKDWICVAGNILCGNSPGIYVFNKAQAYTGGTVNYNFWNQLWLAAPAITYDNNIDRLYLMKTGNPNSGGTGYIDTWYINSVPQLVQSFSYGTNAWAPFATDSAACPKQLGGPTFTAVNIFGASMLTNTVYRNGLLYGTHPIFLPATGVTNRSSTQWWGVNPGSGTITHVGRIDDGSGSTSTYYPNISVNAFSDAVVSYSQFNAGYYQSASYNYRSGTDANGTLPNGIFYYAGQAVDWDGRGGDYNQCVTDPNDDQSFWVVNQIPNGAWETRYSLIPGYFGCYTSTTFGNSVWNGYTKNEASISITSAEMIQNPSIVEYDAGSYIALTPGFVANEGSLFTAYIEGCGGALSNAREKNNANMPNAESKSISPVENQLAMGVFPNPSSGMFNLVLNLVADANVTITIYDATGKVVATPLDHVAIAKGNFNKGLNLEHLSDGIYFCKAIVGSNQYDQKLHIVK